MYTLHVEATQNGLMLIAMAFLIPLLKLINFYRIVYVGAWFSVFSWIFGSLTGAVLIVDADQ